MVLTDTFLDLNDKNILYGSKSKDYFGISMCLLYDNNKNVKKDFKSM